MIINVALVGRGYWGLKLEEYIRKNPKLRLLTVCDAASDLNREVYRNDKVEAVFVATPDSTHYQIVKNVLTSKKHVMCEKPLALTKKECIELESLARKQNVVLCVDYTHTFSDSLRMAQKLVKEGAIGKIRLIEMRMRQLGPFDRENVYWLSGSHMLAILDMFVPLKKLTFYKKDLITFRGKTETGVILLNGNSLKGKIFISLNDPRKEREVAIYGSKGVVIYNPLVAKPLQLATYIKTATGAISPCADYTSFNFDELHNLKHAIVYFYNTINKKDISNIKRAILVTEILEYLNK